MMIVKTAMSGSLRKRTRKGFTFIETLYAMMLLTFSVLALMSVFPMGRQSRKMAEMNGKAASLAQKQMENMRYIGFVNLTNDQLKALGYVSASSPSGGPYSFTDIDVGNGDSPATVLPGGTGTLTITNVSSDTRQVVVTLTWKERVGKRFADRTYTIGTIITNL